MIRNIKHKGLRELFEKGKTSKISPNLKAKAKRRLDVLNQAESLKELNIPGFKLHPLEGKPLRHSIHVNGNYCITFEWDEGDAINVTIEDYH